MQKFLLSAVSALGLISVSAQGAETPLFGVVNFGTCVTDSKAGKKEQENMENMRKQMASLMEDKEKELKEIAAKFEDPEYLDSLSPKAEEELKAKFQALQEELGQYQNQMYQFLNHAQYQMVHKLNTTIAKAAEKIAKEKNLDYVMNRDICYYIRPDLDVTSAVISEMDLNFELEAQAKKGMENTAESHAAEEMADEKGE